MNQTPVLLIGALLGLMITILILKQPYIGVATTVISAPIISLIPPIPYFSSVLPLIGAITFASYLWYKRGTTEKSLFKFNALHTFSLLFIIWMYVSNPMAAWSGVDRNWVFTFVQLWVLMYMAGDLLDEPRKHHLVMGLFAAVSVISAYFAVTQGYITDDILQSARVGGFAAGSNDAARYFVVAMVFVTYLRSQVKHPFIRFLMLGAVIITYLGVFYTASRTGMVLLFFAQMLLFYFQHEGKQRIQYLVIFGLAFALIVLLADPILGILSNILPAITEGTDTMGLRYNLWEAGWYMWLDHPVRGVGIGTFAYRSWTYMSRIPGVTPRGTVAHNIYVTILSETGVIGFTLFMSALVVSIKNYLKAGHHLKSKQMDERNVWLIVFLVMLLGGMTKTDQVDKLLWMVMGISVYYANLAAAPVKAAAQSDEKLNNFRKRKFVSRY
jgi:O-antigen ligase